MPAGSCFSSRQAGRVRHEMGRVEPTTRAGSGRFCGDRGLTGLRRAARVVQHDE